MRLTPKDVGIGLRAPHLQHVLTTRPPVAWFEVHSENYFGGYNAQREMLQQIAKDYPISCHGIGLSLGSSDAINTKHLAQLRHLVDLINPVFVSDHLSWSSIDGEYFNDLLPIPYTLEALAIISDNIAQVQDTLGRPLLIENPSSYLAFSHSQMPEWEFLMQLQSRTQCRLLLDLNNVHVSAFNHQFDVSDYLSNIDPQVVDEIHLAGFCKKELEQGEIWIDTHSRPVSDEVWVLYQQWINQHGPCPTLIEWDMEIPAFAVLEQEVQRAKSHIAEMCL
ncbi:hypothetical protein VST7929_02676 [Vibrio stylophorae]|uniref:Uncharacterized protein n=1 Tax=Vibrio stylophorae TaxID=659351 RepID=A0ABM8ZWK4_9VIBR|nr:DUF692 domain-containing protein [Vibrio stylophorae]CAH0534726.1 hypothetical protein VST7929_02676 [Vibrio stylophorae]